MHRKKKRLKLKTNREELKVLASSMGLEVWEFSNVHLRIVGRQIVDYWPSTDRAWIIGETGRALSLTPRGACVLALRHPDDLPADSQAHMDAITAAA